MNLRVCVSGRERVVPASVDEVRQVFAADAPMIDGTEITVAEGDRWLAALSVGVAGDPAEFLLSGATGDRATASGQVARSEALRRFLEFVAQRGDR
jgi:hypothetical protein